MTTGAALQLRTRNDTAACGPSSWHAKTAFQPPSPLPHLIHVVGVVGKGGHHCQAAVQHLVVFLQQRGEERLFSCKVGVTGNRAGALQCFMRRLIPSAMQPTAVHLEGQLLVLPD